MDALCIHFQHLRVRRRPRKVSPVIDANLKSDILQTLHIAWQGDLETWIPRGVLCQTLTRTDGLLERVERSRQGLKLRQTRAREPHKRLQFLIERAHLNLILVRRRVRVRQGRRDFLYALKKH